MQEIARWFKGDDGQPHLKGRRRATGEQSPGTGLHGSTLNDWVRQYHQGVLALDEALGKIVQTLKDTGQYDNTLIVFTSDQGFAWGQHGFSCQGSPLRCYHSQPPDRLHAQEISPRRRSAMPRRRDRPGPHLL